MRSNFYIYNIGISASSTLRNSHLVGKRMNCHGERLYSIDETLLHGDDKLSKIYNQWKLKLLRAKVIIYLSQNPQDITRFTHAIARKCGLLRVPETHLPTRLPAVKLSKLII